MAGKFPGDAGESKLLRTFLIISVAGHALVMLVNVPRLFFPSQQIVAEEEWAIEADLISDIPVAARKGAPSKEEAQAKEEVLEDKKAIAEEKPQLPDALRKPPPPAKEEEPAPEEEPEEKPKKPKPEPPKPEEKKLAAQDSSYKAQLFDKLMQEQKKARNQQQVQEKQQEKIRAKLAKEISKLRNSVGGSDSGEVGSAGAADYRQVITRYIQQNYKIPDIYHYDGVIAPVVSFSLSASAQLQGLKIIQTSGHQALDHYVLQSMEDAAGFFPKPPAEWVGKEIHVRFLLQ